MRHGSWPQWTGSPTSSPPKGTPTRPAPAGPGRSGSWPDPPKPSNCSSTTNATRRRTRQPGPIRPMSISRCPRRSRSGFDAKAARPKVVLALPPHRCRAGPRPWRGPVTTTAARRRSTSWSSSSPRTGCTVKMQPVLDPAATAPIDGYEVSPRLRAAVRYRQVADVFPFGTCISPSMDLDHTQPYRSMDDSGPPGQTRLGNLGPMARSSHRHGHPRRLAKIRARGRVLRPPLASGLRLPGEQPGHPCARPHGLQRGRLGCRPAATRARVGLSQALPREIGVSEG